MKKNIIVKSFSFVLVALMLVASLAGCGAKAEKAEYDLGIGLVMSGDVEANATTATVAAVVLDADGKIALCRIDEISVAVTVEEDGVKLAKSYKSDAELGNDADAKALEATLVGKTPAEVDTMESVGAEPLMDAVKAAYASEHKVAFKASAEMIAGVAITASASEADGVVEVACDAAVTVVDGGKVATAAIDSIDGKLTVGAGFEGSASKMAQGEDYNMVEHGGAISEWYTQAQIYANTAIGKTPTAVASLETEGVAGCTIYAGGYKQALVKAVEAVR